MTTKALVLAIGLGAFLVAGPAYAGVDPADACKESKAKGSGKKAFDLMKAFGKNIKKPNSGKLAADISKAESKFTKAFNKAESKGGCLTSADSGTIEGKVNLFVCRMVDSVGPATCGNNCAGVGEECDGTDAEACITGLCIPVGHPGGNQCKCQGCGDGILIPGEQCDQGTANGTPASCCNTDCTLKAASSACTDTDGNVCTTAGCDGVSGACDQTHVFAPASDPCPDTDGNDCTTPGCDGSGSCDQAHILVPASTPCTSVPELPCGTRGCDGLGVCDPGHLLEPPTTECRALAGVCDVAENCTGASAECPADGFLPGSAECRASAGVCDPAENCTGSSAGCPADGKSTAECRVSAGVCDPAESCDGVNDDCPADAKSTAQCRASAGVCDPAESCDGVSNDCPADVFLPGSAECRAVAGVCDVPENCTGSGPACPADVFLPGSTECRASTGECDVAENCTGSGANCPANGFVAASTVCTDSDGNVCTIAGCDGAGSCDQGHVSAPDTTICGPGTSCSDEHCDGAGTCIDDSKCCSGLNCSGGSCDLLSFETGIPTGTSGFLRNFRCSNAASSACVDNGDCDFGTCYVTPPFCSGNFTIPCTSNAQCQGTCAEVSGGGLPLALERGGLYTGGGLNSVPLPFPVPDQGLSYTQVTACNSGTGELTLGASMPGQVGERHCTKGRTCTGGTNNGLHCVLGSDCPGGSCTDNCIFGPPLPIPNSNTPATSVCTKNVIDLDASGTAQCDGGESDLSQPLRSVIYLNGDLFKASTPPDIPGVQPCPLCDTLCQGGTKADFPCDDDTDCPGGGTCKTSYECLGGPNDGSPCTPATSDSTALGDPEGSYPTSHDCQNDPLASITDNIGGLPIDFALTTETDTLDAVDRPNGARVFCGFCRDVTGAGSLCFEGDTSGSCPAATPPADGNAVACTSDADCNDGDQYESCVQRNPGAFSKAAATQIELTGATDGGCLGDNALHAADLVGIFCIPPTFDPTVDAAGDLPGPGAALLSGEAQLD